MSFDALRLKLTAVYVPAPEGGYTCRFEELPEVFSEGETIEEAKANLLDALNQIMEYHREIKEGTVRAICRQLEIPRP